jgi:hypothetical protein
MAKGTHRRRFDASRLRAAAIGGGSRALAARRQRRCGGSLLGARLTCCVGLDLADGVFQRQAFFGDFRFRQRRVDRTQLRYQRVARPFVKRPSGFARAAFKTFHGPGDERMVVGHRFSLRSPG